MRFDIPGYGLLDVQHIVCDYNGTLAEDGSLLPGVKEIMDRLAEHVTIHVITADTHGSAHSELADCRCSIHIIGDKDQSRDKRDFVRSLGQAQTVAVGNGRNDEGMLAEAALGIVLIQREGAFRASLMTADIVCTSIVDALELFMKPNRLTATLRNA
ncbi:ATPase P [uncultured Pseudodesulfovibrio sp.]|uniref:HAD family hydrolase n=1 Tax=uncultured Pseudodesulfovibrio sp. TaxID=2035858 RepID=UPI0029C75F1B|nr:ATPase P [uncultured Pseudodesulfovibrio sp.]